MKTYTGKLRWLQRGAALCNGGEGDDDSDQCQWFEGHEIGDELTVTVETQAEHADREQRIDRLRDASVKLSEAAVAVAEGGSIVRRNSWRVEFDCACLGFDAALAAVRENR
jgi:hypothetical protein